MIRSIALAAALALASACAAQAPVPRVYVADFTQDGAEGGAGEHAADVLAHAINSTNRYEVVRIPSAKAALDAARAGHPGPGWLVEGGVRGLRAVGPSSVGLAGLGFSRARGQSSFLRGTPGNTARGASFAVDGWVRVHDAATGANLGTRRFEGWTIGLNPKYHEGGPLQQVLDAAVLDERSGAATRALELLPKPALQAASR